MAAMRLREALAAGADTAQVRAALAHLAARSGRWGEAASQARGALDASLGTVRHPFPGEFLNQALGQIAIDAPPALADSLLRFAATRRPGSAHYRRLAAVAALRAGRCEQAAEDFLELLEFAVEQPEGPALVEECRAGGATVRGVSSEGGTAAPRVRAAPR